MTRTIEGNLVAAGTRFAIVVSRWNDFFSEPLLEGAISAIARHGGDADAVTIVRCPGCFELPLVAKKLAATKKYDAIICLGVLIRGATPHFDYICSATTGGIMNTALEYGLPVSYGVITCDTQEQAIERSGSKVGNKGEEATLAAIEMANLYAAIDEAK